MDRWLDTVTPQQFDQWVAFDSIEVDPVDRIRRILIAGFLGLLGAWGCKLEPEDLDPQMRIETTRKATPNEAVALFQAAYGF